MKCLKLCMRLASLGKEEQEREDGMQEERVYLQITRSPPCGLARRSIVRAKELVNCTVARAVAGSSQMMESSMKMPPFRGSLPFEQAGRSQHSAAPIVRSE